MTSSVATPSYYTPGFTSSFVDRLGESRRRLDDYAANAKGRADALVDDVRRLGADEQREIDLLLRQLESIQHERGVAARGGGGGGDNDDDAAGGIAERRKRLEDKQEKLEEEVAILKRKSAMEKSRLDEALAREKVVRAEAEKIRAKKEEIEMARGVTVEDLTRGLLNYRYTGLQFTKGERNGALEFKFTKLDREDPSRPFTFTLSTDEFSDYELSDVNPPLDESKTKPILDSLNADGRDGFNTFIVGMRKLFKQAIQ